MTFTKEMPPIRVSIAGQINDVAFPNTMAMIAPSFHVKEGKRYRLRMRNASDDIHPIHLHRHSFELIDVAGQKLRVL